MDRDWLQEGLTIAHQNLLDARSRLAALDSTPEPLTEALDAELAALTDGPSKPANRDDWMAGVGEARLVLIGDFATSAAPKALATEALTHCPGATLALTLPDRSHVSLLESFQSGDISSSQLFAKCGLAERIPRFSWRPYFGLLKAAIRQRRRIELLEADSDGPLATRQAAVLQRLAALTEEGPVVALLGELRLAATALAGLPATLHGVTVRLLCDAAGPYDAAVADGGDGTGVAALAPRTWSVQTQPPLTRLLGYINWCETDAESLEGTTLTKRFRTYARTIRKTFELAAAPPRRLTVFAPGDPRYLATAAATGQFDARQLEHLAIGQRTGESRFLPTGAIAYIGQPALSHVAEEAAHFVRSQAGGAGVGASEEDRFWSIAIHEMAAYLGSKVIVPNRFPPTLPPGPRREKLDPEALAHLYGYQMAERIWRRRDHDVEVAHSSEGKGKAGTSGSIDSS